MAEYRTAARPSPGLGRDFVNECERFVAVVAAIRSALHLPALSRMSKQRNLNAEEFALCEAADSVILEAVAERPEQALRHCPTSPPSQISTASGREATAAFTALQSST